MSKKTDASKIEFESFSGKKKSMHVIDQIFKAAKNGEIEPGDKLPSEKHMAKMTNSGRPSVREALSALRLAGIVETRVGDGTYFKEIKSKDAIRENLVLRLSEEVRPLQLQESRKIFEAGVAKLAAKRSTGEVKTSLEKIINKMKETTKKENFQSFRDYHKKFHVTLAEATKNQVIVDTVSSFRDIMDRKLWQEIEQQYYLPEKKEYLKESLKIHGAILAAVQEGDPELAEERMNDHFQRYSLGEKEMGK